MPIRPRFPPLLGRDRPSARPLGKTGERADEKKGDVAASRRHAATRATREEEKHVTLRLAIGRGGAGIELAAPAQLGCLLLTELTATLPGVRFPLDVSGGVARFRHRRGVLQTLQIEVGGSALERWSAPRLRGIVGKRSPEVWIGVRSTGATVCVAAIAAAEESAGANADTPVSDRAPVVAFEVEAFAEQSDLILVVRRARGTDLPAPATAIAIACAQAMLQGVASREGAIFVVRSGAAAVARALLPHAGARVPAAEGLGWASIGAHAGTWILHAAQGALPAAPSEDALRAREIAAMLREGDDALVDGNVLRARELYLDVLERAPRHGEIARRVLEIDARTPGREEAALATIADVRAEAGQRGAGNASGDFGTTPGELLAHVGDFDAAVASLERAGETEPAAPVAARAFEMAAGITRDAEEACHWLDRALARAPRSTTARWLRVHRRLELGRLEDALADVQHLDALAHGGQAKHTVWLRAGRAWQSAGVGARAGEVFERALRHAPDDPLALAGLGVALLSERREARGVAVLARAVELLEAGGAAPTSAAPALVELARALAEHLDDLPAAIARVMAVPAEAPEAMVARGLEGRWRAQLGDAAGAALAFARLRELSTALAASPGDRRGLDAGRDARREPSRGRRGEDPRLSAVAAFLVEAAEFQRVRMSDVLGAQRHLAAALRLRPHDPEVRRLYRDVGTIIAHGERPDEAEDEAEEARETEEAEEAEARSLTDEVAAFASSEQGSAVHPMVIAGLASQPPRESPSASLSVAFDAEAPGTDEEIHAAARVEELTRRLQAEPLDDTAADELASLLELLGRGHELLALMSARLEDASPERRTLLAPRARAVLERLAVQAEEAGRREEASLYRAVMESLPS